MMDLLIHAIVSQKSLDLIQNEINNLNDINELYYKHSALHIAITANYFDCVQLLINNGANVNVKGNNFWSSLHYLCIGNLFVLPEFFGVVDSDGKRQKIIRLLLNNGLDVNAKDSLHVSSLEYACKLDQFLIIEELLNFNATIDFDLQKYPKSFKFVHFYYCRLELKKLWEMDE